MSEVVLAATPWPQCDCEQCQADRPILGRLRHHQRLAEQLAERGQAEDPKRAASAHKPRMSVVPSEVLDEIVAAFTEGANKYGVLNWRKTKDVHASTYFDATMRHLRAWWKREDIDAESNIHHLSKAIASLMVLRDAQLCHVCTDDRPELPSASDD